MAEINILHGDAYDLLRTISDSSIDSVVTDPPYGLSKEPDIREVLTKWLAGDDYEHRGGGFMGKTWDSFVPGPSIWREVYRVLKPGGHALVFAGTRTQDLMTMALRLAGFEVRDVVEWLYFSGFPKSLDISKAFDKRAGAERAVVGVSTNGAGNQGKLLGEEKGGGGCTWEKVIKITTPATPLAKQWDGWGTALKPAHEPIILARKPLDGTVADNVERWGTGAINIKACRIDSLPRTTHKGKNKRTTNAAEGNLNGGKNVATFNLSVKKIEWGPQEKRFPANCVTTEPDAFYSKYFNITPPELCKKASKRDRHSTCNEQQVEANRHPTVKPTDLIAWLIRLVTPPQGTVLDPFAGSGTTGVSAKREGFNAILIEREPEYIEICKARCGV